MKNKIEKCINCKLCTKNCDFLEKYNMDLSDFSKKEDLAYNCFLCGKCREVCPKDIDGKAIAINMRQKKVAKGNKKLIDKNYNMLLKGNLGSNSYEKITKEINNNKNVMYLIRNNEDNWQVPKDIISFTKKNKKKIDEIGFYDVYGD